MEYVYQSIKERRAIRNYKADPVSKEDLDKIIEAGLYAASGKGAQDVIILAITNKELRDELSQMNREIGKFPAEVDPFYGAPVVLVALGKKDWPTHVYDGSLALGNMMMEAYELGLGSCWIHRAKEEFETPRGKEILASLGVTGEYEGIGHCVVGHPQGEIPKPAPRKDDRVFYCE